MLLLESRGFSVNTPGKALESANVVSRAVLIGVEWL
jgi:hypothetical protein